jgi:tetratricopeptide (TPR) repeat protein
MLKPFLTILICLIIFSCNSNGQTQIDTASSEQAFKEGAELFTKSVRLENKDSAAFISLNKQAIQKFELAYQFDTTNRHAWMWLSDCYYNIGEFEKAIYWSKKDMDFAKADSVLLSGRYEDIGLSFLNLLELEHAKTNFRNSISIYNNGNMPMVRIKEVAMHIYDKRNPLQISKLKRKNIDPCNYSVLVYEYALQLDKDYFRFTLSHDETVLKNMRENCR